MSSSLSSHRSGGGASDQRKRPQQPPATSSSPSAAAAASASSVQSAPHTRTQQQQQRSSSSRMKSSLSFSPKNKKASNMSGCQSVTSAASAPVMPSSSSPSSSFTSRFRQQQQQPAPPQSPQQQQAQAPSQSTAVPASSSSSSLPDQINDLLWQGSLEILKLAGGLGGQVVAPPLLHVILPRLWNTTREYITQTTPRRGKDWFAILSSSLSHLIHIVRQTGPGREFIHRLQIWWYSLGTCLTSALTRQVVMDGMAWNVFLWKLLATPECHAVLQQSVVTISRTIDVLYSHKQVVHHGMELVSSWIALLNDASTTAALAEVTARLCLALEMEQVALYQPQQQPSSSSSGRRTGGRDAATKSTAPASSLQQEKQKKQKRRRERNTNQTAVYQTPILMTQTDATVEDVILSSLGILGTGGTAANKSTTTRTTKSSSSANNNYDNRQVGNERSDPWRNLHDDDNLSLSSSTTASPIPSDQENDDDEDDDDNEDNGEGSNTNDNDERAAAAVDLQAKPVNVDYLRQHIISHTSSSTTTKTSHTAKKKQAAVDDDDDPGDRHDEDDADDHHGDRHDEDDADDDEDDDMEDLILVETVPPQYRNDENENGPSKKAPSLLPRQRNRALVQGTKNSDETNLEGDDGDGSDSDNNDPAEQQHQQESTAATSVPIPRERPPPPKLDGESSLSYFYRVLDQVLDAERKKGVQHLWTTTKTAGTMLPRGRVRRPSPSSRPAKHSPTRDENNTYDDSTTMASVWEQFQQVMAEAAAAQQRSFANKDSQPRQTVDAGLAAIKRRYSKVMILGLLAMVLCLMTFSAFGCYGFYAFFFGQSLSPLTAMMPFSRKSQQRKQQDEVVIRIIRQVVHVDGATGRVLNSIDDDNGSKSSSSSFSLLQEPQVMDKISECVANVMDEL